MGSDDGRTHWEGCHAQHLDCARETIARLEGEREEALACQDQKDDYQAQLNEAASAVPSEHAEALNDDGGPNLARCVRSLLAERDTLRADCARVTTERDAAQTIVSQVDDVLVVAWIAVRDGDYRRALHELVSWNIQIHDDPAVSAVARERQDTLAIALAREAGLRRALEHARNELGVPQPGYMAPVANAAEILAAALTANPAPLLAACRAVVKAPSSDALTSAAKIAAQVAAIDWTTIPVIPGMLATYPVLLRVVAALAEAINVEHGQMERIDGDCRLCTVAGLAANIVAAMKERE